MRCPMLLQEDGCIEGTCPFYLSRIPGIAFLACLETGQRGVVAVIPIPNTKEH